MNGNNTGWNKSFESVLSILLSSSSSVAIGCNFIIQLCFTIVNLV